VIALTIGPQAALGALARANIRIQRSTTCAVTNCASRLRPRERNEATDTQWPFGFDPWTLTARGAAPCLRRADLASASDRDASVAELSHRVLYVLIVFAWLAIATFCVSICRAASLGDAVDAERATDRIAFEPLDSRADRVRRARRDLRSLDGRPPPLDRRPTGAGTSSSGASSRPPLPVELENA
jgi:hypothetical protein